MCQPLNREIVVLLESDIHAQTHRPSESGDQVLFGRLIMKDPQALQGKHLCKSPCCMDMSPRFLLSVAGEILAYTVPFDALVIRRNKERITACD